MPELADRLLRTIRKQELLRAGERVAVAVSGGADSVALLRLLVELRGELGIVLMVAHVNHKLRGAESDEDEQFVARLVAEHGLEFAAQDAPVKNKQGRGTESVARGLRYEFFRKLARERALTKVATAHTLDDQAETVLLRMFRGTGIRGLAGILPRLRLEDEGQREVVRPLLGFRRAELREYLSARVQPWREDSSNEEISFLRNRVRRRLLPAIAEELGEAAIGHMAELAEIARAEEELWAEGGPYRVAGPQFPAANAGLDVEHLLALPLAAARRMVRSWVERNAPEASISFRLIEEMMELARGAAGKKIEVPRKGANVNEGTRRGMADSQTHPSRTARPLTVRPLIMRRRQKELVFEAPPEADGYEYALAIPGEILVPALGVQIGAEVVDVESVAGQERRNLLDPARLDAELTVRNWRPGDRFWPAQTKQEKKVKELLGDKHVSGMEKKLWPVAVCRGEIVWMRGFAVPRAWQASGGKAIRIREIGETPSQERGLR